jgi:signal transduction histidine kinase
MRHLLKLVLILAPILGMAQDTVVTITPTMLNNRFNRFSLGAQDGWIFKPGNDTAWAKTAINTSGWKKLNPANLSAQYADKNGKAEGWFRIKIKFDEALKKERLGLAWRSWAAADIYINGTLFSSFGNTGKNGKSYAEYMATQDGGSLNANFKTGVEYVIAVHFVDHLSPLPLWQLKSDQSNSGAPTLTGPKCDTILLDLRTKLRLYTVIWASVCTILGLLFWLLSIQNPTEKELRLIAVCSTFFAFLTYSFVLSSLSSSSFIVAQLNSWAGNILAELIFITIPVIFANVFNRTISRKFKALLVIIVLYSVVANFLPAYGFIPLAVADLSLIIVCIYYIVRSWRTLHGAQWCIVAGLLSAVLFLISLFILASINPDTLSSNLVFSLLAGFVLSFPLSMLVYAAMRFREIIEEVRLNAQQVVMLSEEKREQALNQQKILQLEVDRQTLKIRTSLDNLKAAQNQLIQAEKMASLGELTAGIAHEIQNPLNFVNNFSEVNTELIGEMKIEIEKGDLEEIRAIAVDIEENSKKISMHGKRADAIVKGMLQHSQSGSGTKEPTDINVLADECMRLSYHGLRAKDKSFNAELALNFDESLPKIEAIQQDIVRVMFNLFNNAFYAVNQKQKTAGIDYRPKVSVTTRAQNGNAVINVKDNGTGIPDAIKDKIMQPFFTTKPTGEGTGLGLSLSYDIVVKAHGGSMLVNSVDGVGTEFIIQLPVN